MIFYSRISSMQPRRIGAHLSVAGGLLQAAQNAMTMGANCLQVFSGSPRVWARKPIDSFPYDMFITFCKDHDFGPVFTHALYLINLASDTPDLLTKSIGVLKYDLEFDARIHGGGVIVHLGSHQGRGFAASKEQVVKALKEILDSTPKSSTFLIENSAGQNGKLCSDLKEIRDLLDAVDSLRLGWCFDTCHAFCAGYDLKTVEKEMTTLKLWDTLKVIHLNDSRDVFKSGRDRHENVGEGSIGKDGMKQFLTNPKFSHVPLILEVPGFDGDGPDAKNIAIVKDLIG